MPLVVGGAEEEGSEEEEGEAIEEIGEGCCHVVGGHPLLISAIEEVVVGMPLVILTIEVVG